MACCVKVKIKESVKTKLKKEMRKYNMLIGEYRGCNEALNVSYNYEFLKYLKDKREFQKHIHSHLKSARRVLGLCTESPFKKLINLILGKEKIFKSETEAYNNFMGRCMKVVEHPDCERALKVLSIVENIEKGASKPLKNGIYCDTFKVNTDLGHRLIDCEKAVYLERTLATLIFKDGLGLLYSAVLSIPKIVCNSVEESTYSELFYNVRTRCKDVTLAQVDNSIDELYNILRQEEARRAK